MYNNIQTHYERKEKMDLNQLRNDIDKLDKEILSAFEKRMYAVRLRFIKRKTICLFFRKAERRKL